VVRHLFGLGGRTRRDAPRDIAHGRPLPIVVPTAFVGSDRGDIARAAPGDAGIPPLPCCFARRIARQ
jgi:hypothetical protein